MLNDLRIWGTHLKRREVVMLAENRIFQGSCNGTVKTKPPCVKLIDISWSNKLIILKSFLAWNWMKVSLTKIYLFPLEVLVNENIMHYCL